MQVRLAAALLLALAPCAASLAQDRGHPDGKREGHGPPGGGPTRNSYANPSALIAAEIGLNQQVREEGQWKAYRETAAEGAELLVPERVPAQEWLKDQKSPPAATQSEPYAAWMSCDGSYGVVEGGWTKGSASGLFASVWQRQEDGGYKWLMRHTIGREGSVSAPDMLSATVADCPKRERPKGNAPPKRPSEPATAPIDAQSGYSADRTLYWRSDRNAAGTAWLLVKIRKDGEMQTVLGDELEPQAGN